MSSNVNHTRTTLHSSSKKPSLILGMPEKRDIEIKPQLPSKRKRDSVCGLGVFTKLFTIKPCPESPYDKPAPFKPIRIIGRAQLPLTFLDTSFDCDFTPNRLFSANIEILERQSETRDNVQSLPRVLIARHETDKGLYAVERVEPRVYSLCKLAGWLKEKDVADLWDPLNISRYTSFPTEKQDVNGGEWWQYAAVKVEAEGMPANHTRISMLRLKPQLPEPAPIPREIDLETVQNKVADIAFPSVSEMHFDTPSPQQLLETAVQQYLNEVYMSKTSLAYFAKGPITRLRTAFTSSEEGAPPTHELVTFLRAMLLSHKAGDKKYREKLPEIIKSIPPGGFSDDEQTEGISKSKKSKKKVKLNRDGVYPWEDEMVKKWWNVEMPNTETYGEETTDERIKRRIGDLRVRETLAQMILMLEIIALEASPTYKKSQDEEAAAGDTQAQGETRPKPKKRKQKFDDIKLVLDLLLDKLCIWQSVDHSGILDFDSKPSKFESGMAGGAGGSDRLQSFCIEVIIPFYMSRLPEQAVMINKKLGGPVHTSPPKRKAMKPPTTSRKSGEPKEAEAKKSRRTLARVTTETSIPPRRPTPSLHRSATDSALPTGIKREGSETPLSTIPVQRYPSNAARHSMSRFQHLKGREIDLTTPSEAVTARLKQKKRVEEDLKDAISALKKPNRGLAVGTYVDDMERRGVSTSNKAKKSATSSSVTRDVQVSATPRATRRSKNMDGTPLHNPFGRDEAEAPPSNFCIPSSGVRQTVPGTVQRPRAIVETPSKPASKMDLAGPARRIIFATPVKNRPAAPNEAIFSTPVKGTPMKDLGSSPPAPAVFATPVREAVAKAATGPLAGFVSPAKSIEERDIFDQLGWNDDGDFP
ncbi:hypothetical protein K504DRAFT_459328 [Pleomassaria siparia CBS 279.74]|uniref:DNA replication regulator Sld3 C-terminal domain-containing protein n=1 Tax=Pleomassaria siparia CBS 279.74 TaxID=1314801 RepID=A0A6G1K200_9PLEO|nr:hypothetical protein K504DRAFT_459328 [Pleomassaria siparia CBS 279.74]